MKIVTIILTACFVSVLTEDNFENTGVRIAFKIFEDCSSADAFSSCIKKKAITFLDRLSRMEKFSLGEGITILRAKDTQEDAAVSDNQLEKTLYRSNSAKDNNLNAMLLDKISKFIESRTLEISMPQFSFEDIGEGRKGSGGGGGGSGGGGGGKGGMKGMMGGLMMGIAAKMAALIPVAIAGLFLLAGKALITAKIALLLSGIIAIKKLFGSKQGGSGGSPGGGWQSSGHGGGGGGGGWQSSGGGWDKRSMEDSHHMAFHAYSPK